MEKQLDRLAKRTGRTRSEIVREAIRRQLAITQFFLDTNVLVSAFATRGICADILSVVLGEHQLVMTVLGELRRVLETKMKMPSETIAEAEALLRREGVVSSTPAEVSLEIRDPDDVAVLGEAIQGAAEVVVTGDGDLLEIVSPRGFWELLQGRQ